MVGESDLVSLSCCVDNEVIVEIEQETAHVLVVDLPSSIRFILRYNLSTVL